MKNSTNRLEFGLVMADAPLGAEAMLDGVVYRKVRMSGAARGWHPCDACPLNEDPGDELFRPCDSVKVRSPGTYACNRKVPGGAFGAIVRADTVPTLFMKGILE